VAARVGFGAACIGLAGVLYHFADPFVSPPDDFVAFWAAARLLVAGANPYDGDALLAVERLANWTKDHAYRVWEPPWGLLFVTPLAELPYQPARFVWFVVNLVLLVAAGDRLWRLYDGAPGRRGLAWVLAITFVPAAIAWKTGQLSIVVLAGVVAFLALERRGRPVAAVVSLVVLASAKPHLLLLVWLALGVWVIATRRWRVAIGALAAGLALLAAPLVFNPSILEDFLHALVRHPPRQLAPTIGTLLRWITGTATGQDVYALLFVPSLIGIGWFVRVWSRTGASPWHVTMPRLLLVSLATSPFAWIYDAVLLLVPSVDVFARLHGRLEPVRRRIVWPYATMQVVVLAMNVSNVDPVWYVWVVPAMLVWYWRACRLLGFPELERR
jgi:hypothetical protein